MDDLNGLDNEFYLNLEIRKGGATDENGNFVFEVEASNENLDLQGQIVLQSALMESKEHFLKSGVISLDHLHKRKGPDGQTISDLSMIIGEPVSVRVEGPKTIVKGILYGTKKAAREIIELLKAGSTRVKASVGGIWPQIVRDAKSGAERIAHVLWNDLALTTSPVNNTVSAARFAKSYDPEEFVKALTAGTGTDHAGFSGGRAAIPEDTETYTHNATESSAGYEELKDKIRSLIVALETGEIKTRENAIKFLVRQGLDIERARAAVREISFKEGKYGFCQ
jgi:uncharacterized protein YegP (UPF0339 family)